VGTQASPLRKALVDSGLGEDVIGGGLSTNLRQMTFRVGLKNMASEDVDKAETLILETLARLADEGIEDEMVEAALNSIEFSLRENNTGVYPRGLIAFLKALGAWLYGRDPLTPLRFETPLAELKARLAEDDGYLQSLIRTYLLENPHRVTTILEPDPTFNQRQAEEERQRLEAARAQMSAEDIQAVIEQTRELKRLQEAQDSPEVVALLPTLTIDDLDREVKTIPIEVEQMGARANCSSTISSPTASSTWTWSSICTGFPRSCCPTPTFSPSLCSSWAQSGRTTSSFPSASAAPPAAFRHPAWSRPCWRMKRGWRVSSCAARPRWPRSRRCWTSCATCCSR
jgi:hypothetical protein